MISDMANIVIECFRQPRRRSVWSPELGKYLCPDSEEGQRALSQIRDIVVSDAMRERAAAHPPIDPQFKLVFRTAAIGTLTFVILCVTLSLMAGREPPPLFEKLLTGVFDLAKIGVGAIGGLLGSKALQGESKSKSRSRKRAA